MTTSLPSVYVMCKLTHIRSFCELQANTWMHMQSTKCVSAIDDKCTVNLLHSMALFTAFCSFSLSPFSLSSHYCRSSSIVHSAGCDFTTADYNATRENPSATFSLDLKCRQKPKNDKISETKRKIMLVDIGTWSCGPMQMWLCLLRK